jgi:hypothetical protein
MTGGAEAAAFRVTIVVAEAVLPWSSATLQVMVTVPVAAVLVFRVTESPVPEMVPELVLQL